MSVKELEPPETVNEKQAGYSIRRGYKQTEVGLIPEDWSVRPIGACGEVLGGRQRSPNRPGIMTPYLRVANVFDGYMDLDDVLSMPFTETERATFLLRLGDILLNEGQSLELVGRSAIYRGVPAPCCFQNTLVRFRAGKQTSVEYAQLVFHYYLHSGVFQSIALQTTSIAHLGAGRLAKLLIPFPTLAEQEAIAEALDDADSLVEALEQMLAKKRNLKRATMQQLLTGKKRLPGFCGSWESKRLSEFGSFLKGSGVKKDDSRSGHLPCIRYGEIYTTHSDYIRHFRSFISHEVAATATRLTKGDLLFAGSGETRNEIGKCVAFVDEFEAYAGGDIVILRTKSEDALFFGYYLNSETIRAQKASMGQGDAVVHIGSTALGTISCNVPPFDERIAIATVLSDIDTSISAIDAKIDKTRQIKAGMMQELLTGRTRLV